MDADGLPEDEVAEAYRVLRRVNHQLGNLRSVRREVERLLKEDGPWGQSQGVRILDVGSGSGDIPLALATRFARRTVCPWILTLDRDPTAVGLARSSGLNAIRGDALRLPFGDASVDMVMAVKFAHHFTGAALARLLAEMTRVSRRRVLVLDIRRHWFAYYGFIIWSRVLTRNRLVRYDGPLSVLRGFTASELAGLGQVFPEFDWQVRSYAGFQLALVGRRTGTSGRKETTS